MKHLLFSICLLISCNLFSQTTVQNYENQFEYTCDQLNYDSESNVILMVGNVNMKTDKLEIKNASEITYNQETKELRATGSEYFTFDGTIIMSDSQNAKSIKYIVGEDVAYIE